MDFLLIKLRTTGATHFKHVEKRVLEDTIIVQTQNRWVAIDVNVGQPGHPPKEIDIGIRIVNAPGPTRPQPVSAPFPSHTVVLDSDKCEGIACGGEVIRRGVRQGADHEAEGYHRHKNPDPFHTYMFHFFFVCQRRATRQASLSVISRCLQVLERPAGSSEPGQRSVRSRGR